MKKRITWMLVLAVVFLGNAAHAQQLKEGMMHDLMEDRTLNFYDVQKTAESYFQKFGKGEGTGYEQYKQWEYEMQFWVDKKGNRVNPRKIFDEANRFRAGYNEVRKQSIPWQELGPTSWNKTSSWSPGLGRIDAIAVDPNDPSIVYIGSPEGGVWKTYDLGYSWQPLTDGLTYMNIGHIAIDPINTSVVYIGTAGAGMLKSPDGGTTINQINNGLGSNLSVKKIIVDPFNTDHVLIATTSGIYNSTDGGASWSLTFGVSMSDIEFKPDNSQIVYACGNNFYKSTDGGASFTQITNGITTSGAMRIAVTPANPNLVCAVQCSGNIFGAFYRSINAGTAFTKTITGSPGAGTNFFGYYTDGTGTTGQGAYNMGICISPYNANIIQISGVIAWKSTDGGYNFIATTQWNLPSTLEYTHADIHVLEYFDNSLFVGSDGGIYYSIDDALNFYDLSAGLGIRMFYRMGGSKTDPARVVGGSQDNGCSIRKGTGWIDWLGADGMECAIDPSNANIIYGSIYYGSMYRSSNGGNTYTSLNSPDSGNWITPFVIDPNNPSTLYVGDHQIYRVTNSGTTWAPISTFSGSWAFDCLEIAPSNSQYLYASRGSELYRTTNGGASWISISSGLGSATINRIVVLKNNPDKVAVAVSGSEIYSSSDGGTTWSNITGNFPSVSARCLVYENKASEGIYVGTNSGVYYKNNTMTNWVSFADGLPMVPVNELEIQDSIGKIRAATYGRGIWESYLFDVANDVQNLPSLANRPEIFPNPSSGIINLKGENLKSGTYRVTCESVTGQVVYTKNISVSQNVNTQVNLKTLAKGMYYMKVADPEYMWVYKILIQ